MRTVKGFGTEKAYVSLIGKTPVLTREEEYAAWKRGDTDLLIRSQLPWVMRIAITMCRQRKFSDTDLAISAANMALLTSIRFFDGERGYRLTTFVYRMVYWKVRDEIDSALSNCGPSRGVAKRRGVSCALLGVSFDELVADDSSGASEEFERSEAIETVRAAVKSLPPHYRRVVVARMEGKRLKEIAEDEKVTKQAVSQRWLNALDQLRGVLSRDFAVQD